jgi:hypothetical protein
MTRVIEIDEANEVFGICGDFIVNIGANSLVRYLGSTGDVLIGKDWDGIGAGCFAECGEIWRVSFERDSRLSVFGAQAFANCQNLKSIHIVRSVEIISEQCFAYCGSLRTVTFEPGSRVSILGDGAFYQCSSLESICIPSSVTTIGLECFRLCRSLSRVELEGDCRVSSVGPGAFYGCSVLLHLPSRLTASL